MLVAIAACGDNDNKQTPDAKVFMDAAPPDAFVDCNYTEAHDTTNDYQAASGYMLEETGITFHPGGTRTVCGTINNGHYDMNATSVDVDNYGITLAGDADVLVELSATTTISTVGVFAVRASDMVGVGGGNYIGDHAVFHAHLTAGKYEFSVEAYDNQDSATSVPYKMRIFTDMPATRCSKVTAAADYTEANDGGANTGNDMIDIDYSLPFLQRRQLTPSTTDAPEPTGLTIGDSTNYRISGTAASRALLGSYFDRDTYLITTGATTNQLGIRLNWPSTTADLDYYLFPAGGTTPYDSAAKMMLGEDEFTTTAVQPNTQYWLWIGAYSSSTGLPATYDFSLCGEKYTPF